MALPARRILRSFGYALEGIVAIARTQPNFGVHLLVAALALGLASWLGLPPSEVAAIVLAIGLVLAAEAFNTAIEDLCDATMPRPHPLVKSAKDAAAAGVLLAVMAAVVVGLALFGPRLLALRAG